MSFEIKKGVHSHILVTDKYKTINLQFNFRKPLDVESLSKRAMLAAVMETNSLNYPSQTALGEALSDLYGSSFGTSSQRFGDEHLFRVEFIFPNPKFLKIDINEFYKEIFSFIQEIIFVPHVIDGKFHEPTFKREQENLLEEYASYRDDKQLYSALKLNELYYPDASHQVPGKGRAEELNTITPSSLYEVYQEMIAEDLVDVLVTGDIETDIINDAIASLPWTDRSAKDSDVLYLQRTEEEFRENTEIQEVNQAKLHMAFETPFLYGSDDYYAGLLFNGIFGGFSHSKLFINVREKESLAYYASSSVRSLTGLMTVQAGIDQKMAEKTEQIILEQLDAIRKGEISDNEIEQTKAMLTNSFLQTLDSPHRSMVRAYRDIATGVESLTAEEYFAELSAVTKEDIQRVAEMVKYRAKFILKGVDVDA